MGLRRRYFTVIVVCDGLGSRPLSSQGSLAACDAVVDALRDWSPWPGASTNTLLRLIHSHWALRVTELGGPAHATTCLFAAGLAQGGLIVARLGDGLAAIRSPDGRIRAIGAEREGRLNETTGLGIATALTDWTIHHEPGPEPSTAVMLATDGVSDDIIPNRRESFVGRLRETLLAMEPGRRSGQIRRQLLGWPTPLHSDDKTLAMLWLEPESPYHEH